MPPQSRGQERPLRTFSGSPVAPPTLGTYLDRLPSPTSTIQARQTPSDQQPNGMPDREPIPSPIRPPSHLSRSSSAGHDGEDVTLDDDDFEIHYSRHSSPASSSPTQSEQSDAAGEHSNGEDDEKNEDDTLHQSRSNPPPRPPSSSNLALSSFQPPVPLYPPFYNRPPTPLPPSPSLTSLLRPPSLLNRSTASTRPTTPDSSDAETPNDTEAAVAQSARRARPVPPTSPKVPTYEYYGFAVYLGSSLAFLLYILWSYTPSAVLHAVGITYYPNRWWSLAIPAWIVMLLVFIYVALLAYNVEHLTLPMTSVECIVDEAANIAILDQHGHVIRGGSKRVVAEQEREEKRRLYDGQKGSQRKSKKGSKSKRDKPRDSTSSSMHALRTKRHQHDHHPHRSPDWNWRAIWNEGTDAVMDVPLGGVCEVLYGEGQEGI